MSPWPGATVPARMDVAAPPLSAASLTAVIPAHNAAATIGTAIAGLEGIGQVVVVDDGSTDETAAVARSHGARVIRHEVARGPAGARNAGIDSTDAALVVLLDADAEPEPGWLEPLIAHLADPRIGGAAPRVRARGDATTLGRYEAAMGPLDRGTLAATVHPDGPVPFVSTTALLLRRDAWEAVGGFAEELRFGEDLDLAWRLAAGGQPLLYEPAATVWHEHRADLRAHLANRYRYGTASGPLARRHGRPSAAVAPPLLSAAFAAVVLGRGRTALALGAAAIVVEATSPTQLGESDRPSLVRALRDSAAGARGLASALSRPWLPLALALAIVMPRSRLRVAGLIFVRSLAVRRRTGTDLPLVPWMAMQALDDAAFSAGVIRGCFAARTARPLLPVGPRGHGRRSELCS